MRSLPSCEVLSLRIGFEVVCKLDNAKVGLLFGLTKRCLVFCRSNLKKYIVSIKVGSLN